MSEPTHIYYNLELVNNETTGNNIPRHFSMIETRNSPYLQTPEDYYMSVVRFQLQSPSLPVFIPAILLGQIDVNKTAYSITMEILRGGVLYAQQEHIMYVPYDATQKIPEPPLQTQDLTSNYYYIYSYQQWIRMVNTAFSTCLTGLTQQVLAQGQTMPTANPPFMEFNLDTQIANINADENGYNTINASVAPFNDIRIYFNTAMATLYNNFPLQKRGYGLSATSIPPLSLGRNFQLEVLNIYNSNILNLPTYNALQVYQEGTTTGLLNPIQSIVFTTGMFPIYNENVSVPEIFNSNTEFNKNNNNNLISPIITDFVIPWSATNQYRQTIEYAPSGEYRLVDMFGRKPLDSIQIQVYWKDIYGGLHPFEVNSGCSGAIKLMFRKKTFNQ
jgi:hypothetical protein